MASAGAQAYMGVWGLAPSGVQGKTPGQGVRGRNPLKLTRFCNFKFKFLMKNAPCLCNLNRIHHAENINIIYIMSDSLSDFMARYKCFTYLLIVTNGLNNGLL